jgi:hypothetical protein
MADLVTVEPDLATRKALFTALAYPIIRYGLASVSLVSETKISTI